MTVKERRKIYRVALKLCNALGKEYGYLSQKIFVAVIHILGREAYNDKQRHSESDEQ